MQFIQVIVTCPSCDSQDVIKNGIKKDGQQNYLCTNCKRQFVHDFFLKYNGSKSQIDKKILLMLARGIGIRDISVIEQVSVNTILKILLQSEYKLLPKQKYYKRIEIDEFWTYVSNKKNKVWLIYAYSRTTNEILTYVWGKRDYETALKLKQQLKQLPIEYEYIAIDKWDSFVQVFKDEKTTVGKYYTVGIEGNNCRLRQRVKRVARRTCSFSKKIEYHKKIFELVFYYINNGFV